MYKFINLTNKIILSKNEKKFIKKLNKQDPNVWDISIAPLKAFKRGDEAKKLRLKDNIRHRLKKLQENFCIYCGGIFDSATETHIEHFIPKQYLSKYTFEPLNLALACQRCNMDMKRTNNYLVNRRSIYIHCTFNIVHPYLDNLDDHIEHNNKVILSSKTLKGQKTISEFCLNEEQLLVKRGQFLNFIGISLHPSEKTLIDSIISRIYHQ